VTAGGSLVLSAGDFIAGDVSIFPRQFDECLGRASVQSGIGGQYTFSCDNGLSTADSLLEICAFPQGNNANDMTVQVQVDVGVRGGNCDYVLDLAPVTVFPNGL